MKKSIKFGLSAFAFAVLHLGTVIVIGFLIWLGSWGAGPQGGEVALTPEERERHDRTKPYEEAFMCFIEGTGSVLTFPMSCTGSEGHQMRGGVFVNSGIWGIALATGLLLITKRKKSGLVQQTKWNQSK